MIPENHGIFLDSASGAPLHPRVVAGLMAELQALAKAPNSLSHESSALSPFSIPSTSPVLLANPNSLHQPAQRMRRKVRETAAVVLDSLGLGEKEYGVVFTSSGTEAVQMGTRSFFSDSRADRSQWLLSAVEHSCNRELMSELAGAGHAVTEFPLGLSGETDWETVAVRPGVRGLLTLMSVQNESGITSHILNAAAFAKTQGLELGIDHVAGWGKISVSFARLRPAFIAVSGHKIGAFAGIGALVYRKDLPLHALMPGTQQNRMRGGTENTPGILSVLLAWDGKRADPDAHVRVEALRDRFEAELIAEFPCVTINGSSGERSPYVSSVTFTGETKSLELPLKLDLQGIALSSGSACRSGVPKPSFVMLHYGHSEIDARNTLRVSLHDHSTWDDLATLLAALRRLVSKPVLV